MTKELEALDRLYKCNDDDYTLGYQQHDYKLLQQALTELKAIKEANPSEALNDLEIIREAMLKYRNKLEEVKVKCIVSPQFASIRQALLKAQEQEKVLEIIKKKNINLKEIKNLVDYEQYKLRMDFIYGECIEWNNKEELDYLDLLVEEEFDLLKRYLDE